MFVMTVFQATAYHAVRQFPWFTPFVPTSNTGYTCYENYSVYCVSMFQYIIMVIIFSRGAPYRRAIYTNGAFMFSIFSLTVICAYITVYPANWIVNALQLILPPVYDWRLIILALALVNFVVCLFIESFIIEHVIENTLKKKFSKPEKSKKKYIKIEHELKNCENWSKFGGPLPIPPILRKERNTENVATVRCNGHRATNVPNDHLTNNFSNSDMLPKGPIDQKNGFENYGFVKDEV